MPYKLCILLLRLDETRIAMQFRSISLMIYRAGCGQAGVVKRNESSRRAVFVVVRNKAAKGCIINNIICLSKRSFTSFVRVFDRRCLQQLVYHPQQTRNVKFVLNLHANRCLRDVEIRGIITIIVRLMRINQRFFRASISNRIIAIGAGLQSANIRAEVHIVPCRKSYRYLRAPFIIYSYKTYCFGSGYDS